MTPAQDAPARPLLPWMSWAFLIAAGVFALRPLTFVWDTNPNYSFGWFVPFVAALLFFERWPTRPPRAENGWKIGWPLLALWSVIFLALRLAIEVSVDWRPGLWLIMGLYVAVLAAWLGLYGGRAWIRHFAFPICFLFFCVPWFFQIEFPLTQYLMRLNAAEVAWTLQFFGIPASAYGNIITLQTCQLGVEEACSGIISLQASIILGVLLGDVYHLSTRRRWYLVVISLGFALLGNYGRTLFLGLIASYSGESEVEAWHDTAGFAILIFTAVSTWLVVVLCFGDGTKATAVPLTQSAETVPSSVAATMAGSAQRFALAILLAVLLSEGIAQSWFAWRESSLTRYPEWSITYPDLPTLKKVTLPQATINILLCDSYESGKWQDPNGWDWTSFWFRYRPKFSNQTVLAWHNPSNCLPAVGLAKDIEYPDFAADINGIHFNVQASRFVTKGIPVYVFWLIYPTSGRFHAVKEPRQYELSFKFSSHLQALWDGNRGVGIETLETVITGPKSFEEARDGYLKALQTMAQPLRKK